MSVSETRCRRGKVRAREHVTGVLGKAAACGSCSFNVNSTLSVRPDPASLRHQHWRSMSHGIFPLSYSPQYFTETRPKSHSAPLQITTHALPSSIAPSSPYPSVIVQ